MEALSANRITLYDFKHHFFRIFNPVTNQTDLLRDTLYREAGSSFVWGFLIFTDQPLIPDINRWPLGKKAALCISNDADGETLPRLQAVFEGSSNPDSPKYYTKGIFARDIKVSNTIFGVYQGSLGEMWHKIKDHGNRIGYHTLLQKWILPVSMPKLYCTIFYLMTSECGSIMPSYKIQRI